MHPAFQSWFLEFTKNYRVSLVTGSDCDKTIEQVGEDIFNSVEYSFNCAGNAVYQQGQLVYQNEWGGDLKLLKHLGRELVNTNWRSKLQVGNHVEMRPGMINFSIVGRNCTQKVREEYYDWDQKHKERADICRRLKEEFPELTFEIGGQISIDIFPNGCDKSQVLKYFNNEEIIFFGDRIELGGNDYHLAQAIIDKGLGRCYNVSNWLDTEKVLKEICSNVWDLLVSGSTILVK